MPSATFRWIEQNYLPIGKKLRVAGVLLHLSTDGKHFDFETVIPASYEIVAPGVGTVMANARRKGVLSFHGAFTLLSQLPLNGLFGAVRRSPFQTHRVVTSLDS
jgi:hypothetical protein